MKTICKLSAVVLLISIISPVLISSSIPVSAACDVANEAAINEMDIKIRDMYVEQNRKMIKDIDIIKDIPLDPAEMEKQIDSAEATNKRTVVEKELQILKKYGFEVVDADDNDNISEVSPMSTSEYVVMDDISITYNRTSKLWRYSGSYDWIYPLDYDVLYDTEDIMSVSITDDTNFTYWYSTATIYDMTGDISGTVYTDGSNSYGSNITLRGQETNGVMYNVIDMFESTPNEYKADHANIVAYFKKTGSAGQSVSTKIFTSYHHNYKFVFWNGTASITYAGIKDISGALSVSYSLVNGYWQKASGGIIITDPR